jgi:hypothetical protein
LIYRLRIPEREVFLQAARERHQPTLCYAATWEDGPADDVGMKDVGTGEAEHEDACS